MGLVKRSYFVLWLNCFIFASKITLIHEATPLLVMIICSTGRVLTYAPDATQDIKSAEPKSPQTTPTLSSYPLRSYLRTTTGVSYTNVS